MGHMMWFTSELIDMGTRREQVFSKNEFIDKVDANELENELENHKVKWLIQKNFKKN